MSTMQFNARETSIGHESGSIHELTNDSLHVLSAHLLRRRPSQAPDQSFKIAITEIDRHCAGRERLREHASVACDAEGLSTWVADLSNDGGAVLLACIGIFLPLSDEIGIALCVFVLIV